MFKSHSNEEKKKRKKKGTSFVLNGQTNKQQHGIFTKRTTTIFCCQITNEEEGLFLFFFFRLVCVDMILFVVLVRKLLVRAARPFYSRVDKQRVNTFNVDILPLCLIDCCLWKLLKRKENSADPMKNSSTADGLGNIHTKRADLFPINIRPEGYTIRTHTRESAAPFHFILFYIISDGWRTAIIRWLFPFFVVVVEGKKRIDHDHVMAQRETHTGNLWRDSGSPFQSNCHKNKETKKA